MYLELEFEFIKKVKSSSCAALNKNKVLSMLI